MNILKNNLKLKLAIIFAAMFFILMFFPMAVSAATITNVAITGAAEPVAGQTKPNVFGYGETTDTSLCFVGGGQWFKGHNISTIGTAMGSSETFVAGQTYTLCVGVKPTAGNTFSANPTATINGVPAHVLMQAGELNAFLVFTMPGFTVTPAGNYTFPAKTEGFTTSDEYKFTVQNTVDEKITVDVKLSDAWTSGFNVTTALPGNPIAGIDLGKGGGKVVFTISPKTTLLPGIYDMKVTVTGKIASTGASLPPKSFDVSFTVNGIKYPITVQNDGDGTASADRDSAELGEKVTLTATPKAGYRFKEWQVVSGDVIISDNIFYMNASPQTVKAIFEPLPAGKYAVNIQTGEGGTAKANVTSAKKGDIVTLTVKEDEGYMFKKWSIVSGGVTIYGDEFTMPDNDVTIKATFELIAESDVPDLTEPSETEPDTTGDLDEINLSKDEENSNTRKWLWILFGVLLTVIIGSVVALVIIRKKEKKQSGNNSN